MGNILIVEEDQDILDVLIQILQEANHNPVSASKETKAWEFLALPFDLVIVDTARPAGPGEKLPLLEKLSEYQPGVPVMRLPKPFDLEEIMATIGEMVDQNSCRGYL